MREIIYTSPLFTCRKPTTARLLSRWLAKGCVRLLNAHILCLSASWFYVIRYCCQIQDLNGIRIPVNIKGFREHMVHSAPCTSNLHYSKEEWLGLKGISLVCPCTRIDHILLNQFCTPWGHSTHWDTVLVHLSLATTLMQNPSSQRMSRIIDFYFHVFL